MSDVFISYSREDRPRVEPLVRLLESLGLTIWWDHDLMPGDSFERAIDKAILDAKCIVVVWSKDSIDSQWVRSEALEGLDRNILVPILIDEVRVPVAFRQSQAVNFFKWPHHYEEAEYNALVQAVQRKLGLSQLVGDSPKRFLTRRARTMPLLLAGTTTVLLLLMYMFYPISSISTMDIATSTGAHQLTGDPITYRKYLQAQDRIRRGEHEDLVEAISLLEQVTLAAPDFADGFATLCQSYLSAYRDGNNINDYQSAKLACDRALLLAPDNVDVYLALGELYAISGDTRLSEDTYTKVISSGQKLGDANIGLGYLYMKDGRLVQAETAFKQAVNLEPGYIKAQNALGSFFFQQGMYNRSGETYKKITDLAPQNAMAWNNLGVSKMLAGEFESAFEAWRTASELNKQSGAYSNMGYVLYLLGRFEEAAEYVKRSVDETPTDHRLWGNLGDMLRFIPGREADTKTAYSKAIALAEQNRRINPDDPYLLGRLAVYYSATDDTTKAREAIESARRSAQNDIYVLFDIAVALSILGDDQAAVEQLKIAKAAGYPTVLSDADPQFN